MKTIKKQLKIVRIVRKTIWSENHGKSFENLLRWFAARCVAFFWPETPSLYSRVPVANGGALIHVLRLITEISGAAQMVSTAAEMISVAAVVVPTESKIGFTYEVAL